MVLTIGASTASDFTRPIALMRECHRRVERFLGVLVTIAAERHGERLDPDDAEAMATALRYFAEAAPKHTADEEESLFPRLRRAENGDVQTAIRIMAELERDHALADERHREVQTLGRRWLNDGMLPVEDAKRLANRLEALSAIYTRHIAIEDDTLFPFAEAALDGAAKRAVGIEMAKRRDITHR